MAGAARAARRGAGGARAAVQARHGGAAQTARSSWDRRLSPCWRYFVGLTLVYLAFLTVHAIALPSFVGRCSPS